MEQSLSRYMIQGLYIFGGCASGSSCIEVSVSIGCPFWGHKEYKLSAIWTTFLGMLPPILAVLHRDCGTTPPPPPAPNYHPFQGLPEPETILGSVVQYLGVLKVNLWEYKGNILTQKG